RRQHVNCAIEPTRPCLCASPSPPERDSTMIADTYPPVWTLLANAHAWPVPAAGSGRRAWPCARSLCLECNLRLPGQERTRSPPSTWKISPDPKIRRSGGMRQHPAELAEPGSGAGGSARCGLRAAGQVRDQGVAEVAGAFFQVADLAAGAGVGVVVAGAEVLVAGAGGGQQLVVDLQLGVAEGDAGFELAAAGSYPPVAGAFAGRGLAGWHGGLAEDGAQVPVAFLGSCLAFAAGLVVQRGAAGPGGQVGAVGEPGHVRSGLGQGVLGGAASPAGHRLGLLELFLIRLEQGLDHRGQLADGGLELI